jgi:hypothetical protein
LSLLEDVKSSFNLRKSEILSVYKHMLPFYSAKENEPMTTVILSAYHIHPMSESRTPHETCVWWKRNYWPPEFFSSPPRPERLWGPPSLLSIGYQGLLP